MGNILGDGMIDRSRITKTCENCHLQFEGWSENARCIKGKMPAQPYCSSCQIERNKSMMMDLEKSMKK